MATEEQSTEKPPTMRQLTERIAEGVTSLVKDAETKRASAVNTAAPPPYREADALDACIGALQRLKDTEASAARNRNSYDYPMQISSTGDYRLGWASGNRILRFLADRFGVDLIERKVEPCSRPHLDGISSDQFFNALRSAGGDLR